LLLNIIVRVVRARAVIYFRVSCFTWYSCPRTFL